MYRFGPQTKNPSPDPKLKGQRNGNCNVTHCQMPNAVYYNPYMNAFYCESCVRNLHEAWRDIPSMPKRCYVPAPDEALYVVPPK